MALYVSFLLADDAMVYVWDMSSLQCIHRFRDEGCLNGTSICTDELNNLLACGYVLPFLSLPL